MHIFFLQQDKEETGTQLFLALNSPIPSCSPYSLSLAYSLGSLSHTITKYQALPSPISCMLGELRRSAGPRNKDTQSVVVGASVCQSHLHSTVFQPASFKWSSEEGELLSRSGVHRDVGGEAWSMCAGGEQWKSPAAGKLCVYSSTQRVNVWWEWAETDGWKKHTSGFACFIPLTSNLYIYLLFI